MKKTITYQTTACDFCEKHSLCLYKCIGCGKDICSKCAVVYNSEKWHSDMPSDRNGFYCKDCDVKLINDPIHQAWVAL